MCGIIKGTIGFGMPTVSISLLIFFIDIKIIIALILIPTIIVNVYQLSRGGNFKKIVPVGSFFLEQDWYKKVKDQKKISKIDILFTGLKPNDWLYINNINQHNNNLYRMWIKKIAKLYPHLSISIKNHGDLKDNKIEEEFFKNTKVQILKNKSINASYGYINKSYP